MPPGVDSGGLRKWSNQLNALYQTILSGEFVRNNYNRKNKII